VEVAARVELEELVGRAAASSLAVRVVRVDPSSAELAAWVAPFSAEWADAAAPAVSVAF
jgi:hypothetical protein